MVQFQLTVPSKEIFQGPVTHQMFTSHLLTTQTASLGVRADLPTQGSSGKLTPWPEPQKVT